MTGEEMGKEGQATLYVCVSLALSHNPYKASGAWCPHRRTHTHTQTHVMVITLLSAVNK